MYGMTMLFRGCFWSLVGYDDGTLKLVETQSLDNDAMNDPTPWPAAGDAMEVLLPGTDDEWISFVAGEDGKGDEAKTIRSRLVRLEAYHINDIGYINRIDVACVPELKRWYVRRSRPVYHRPSMLY